MEGVWSTADMVATIRQLVGFLVFIRLLKNQHESISGPNKECCTASSGVTSATGREDQKIIRTGN